MKDKNVNQIMKITGGICRGRSLSSFAGSRTRPTSSKVRQALFSILGNVEGDHFLDLYAGTGSVGLEALSRGAKKVDFVEIHKPTSKLINENLKTLSLEGEVHCLSGAKFVSLTKDKWDIVFVDPPFVDEYPVLENFGGLVADGGWLIYQYPTKERISWARMPDKVYEYGESSLAILYY